MNKVSDLRRTSRWGDSLMLGIVVAATMAMILLSETSAQAQQGRASVEQKSIADVLFREARNLIRAGDLEHACPKLAESQRLDPAGGTVLLLALCLEKSGKTASSWIRFQEALSMARSSHRDDRANKARAHLAVLEPRLVHVHILVPPGVHLPAGASVYLDETKIPSQVLGDPIPVDPGIHVLRVTADGYHEGTANVDAHGEGTTTTIQLPNLKALPAAPKRRPPSPAPHARPARQPTQRTPASDNKSAWSTTDVVGWSLVGAGVVGVGVGSYFGVEALADQKDAEKLCPSNACADQDGVDKNRTARREALVADLSLGAGIIGVGVGAFLLLTSGESPHEPVSQTRSWRINPSVGRDTVSVRVGSRW